MVCLCREIQYVRVWKGTMLGLTMSSYPAASRMSPRSAFQEGQSQWLESCGWQAGKCDGTSLLIYSSRGHATRSSWLAGTFGGCSPSISTTLGSPAVSRRAWAMGLLGLLALALSLAFCSFCRGSRLLFRGLFRLDREGVLATQAPTEAGPPQLRACCLTMVCLLPLFFPPQSCCTKAPPASPTWKGGSGTRWIPLAAFAAPFWKLAGWMTRGCPCTQVW